MTWSNKITLFRMVLVPIFILAIFYHQFEIAFFIFLVAAATDALDGYLARVRKEKTRLGTIMDPLADKMLLGSAFVSLALVSGLPEYLAMPGYVPIIIISRDVLILTGAVLLHLVKGRIEVKPSILGKVTTFFQMLTIILVLLKFPYSSWVWNITVVFTVLSGLDYVRISSRMLNGK